MIGRLVGQGLHHQSYHTQMHTTQHHSIFCFFFVFLCSFADMESALKQFLRAKCGAAANGRGGFELLQSGFKDPQFTAAYAESQDEDVRTTTLLES